MSKQAKIERLYGKLLSNLKDDRETGDYEAISYIDEEMARNALDEAQQFFGRMKTYLAPFLA